MPSALKPCLKSGPSLTSGAYPSTNRPPIPFQQAQDAIPCGTPSSLPRSSSFMDNSSALPYAQPFVHFPPSPVLTSTYVVDPPRLYDRTPIVVSQNECALPSRGCPGRTYTQTSKQGGNHAHPNSKYPTSAYSGMDGFFLSPSHPPGLIPDEGSSEDSDGLVSPPPEPYHYPRTTSPYCHSSCTPEYHSSLCHAAFAAAAVGNEQQQHPSMFLPHPPSPRSSKQSSPPSARRTRPRPAAASFGSSWDSPCLGGF